MALETVTRRTLLPTLWLLRVSACPLTISIGACQVSFREEAKPTNVSTDLNANVAIDLFLDSDKQTSSVTTKAAHEVMLWLGMFGPATQPIGYSVGSVATKAINGTTLLVARQ
jgi:hypothetical protein